MLLAVCQKYGIEVENSVIPDIASGFGGGIGNTGAVCGAVVGAVMAYGLIKGRGDTIEDMFRNAARVQEFRRRFEERMGTINCRELTGVDLTDPAGIQELTGSDVAQKACFPAVGSAYELVVELLEEENQ